MGQENVCGSNGSCEMKSRIEALEKDSERNQKTHKEFFGRFEDIGKDMARNEVTIRQIGTDINSIKDTQKKTLESIEAINEKPAKRWEGLVDKAVWAVCAAVIAFLLARLGLGG